MFHLRRALPLSAALFVIISSWTIVSRYGVGLPTGDEWDLAKTLLHFHTNGIDWPTLTAFHNEHRIFVPRLYFQAHALFTGWNTLAIKFANVIPLALSAYIIVSLTLISPKSLTLAGLTTLSIALVLGSWSQWQNYLWSFQFPWFFVPFLFITSSYLLARPLPANGLHRGAATIALLITSGCMANGIITWFAILPLWFRRKSDQNQWLILGWWVAGFTLAYIFTFSGSPNTESGVVEAVFSQPAHYLIWLLYLLGQPLVSCIGPNAGAVPVIPLIGAIGGIFLLAIIITPLYQSIKSKTINNSFQMFAISLTLFGLLSGLAISAGRFRSGLDLAAQSRYITFTQLSLVGGLLLSYTSLDRVLSVKRSVTARLGIWAATVALAVLLAVPFFTTTIWLTDMRLSHARLKAVLALSRLGGLEKELSQLSHTNTLPSFLNLIERLETAGLYYPSRLDINAVPTSSIINKDIAPQSEGQKLPPWSIDAIVAAQNIDDKYFKIIAVSEARHRQLMENSDFQPTGYHRKDYFLLGYNSGKNLFIRL